MFKTIPENCFNGNKYLAEVMLPAECESIGRSAFEGCDSLNVVNSLAKLPPVCADKNVFSNRAYENAVVTVPVGTKKSYAADNVWSLFKNIRSNAAGYIVKVSYDHEMGAVTINGSSADSVIVAEDEPLSIAVIPAEGYEVVSFTVNGTDVMPEFKDNVLTREWIDENLDVTVGFGRISYAFAVNGEMAGGHITVNGEDTLPASIWHGEALEIGAVPDKGYKLAAFSLNGSDCLDEMLTNGVVKIEKVTGNISVDAVFELMKFTASATVSHGEYGSLTLNGKEKKCELDFGSTLTVDFLYMNEGCHLTALTVNDEDALGKVADGMLVIANVEEDMTIAADFGITSYGIGMTFDSEKGMIMPLDSYEIADVDGTDVVKVPHGSTARFSIKPSEGYEVKSVTFDGKDVTADVDNAGVLTVVNVVADHELAAAFDIRKVWLTVLGLDGGRISLRHDYGAAPVIVPEAEEGWEFHSMTVGDTEVTELDETGAYEMAPMEEDVTVSIVFVKKDTGIAGTPADVKTVKVCARNHVITIEGKADADKVTVHDAAGLLIYDDTKSVIPVERDGVVIVTVAGRSYKIYMH